MIDDNGKTLVGRTLYIPQMSFEAARMMAAAFQSAGIDARPSPSGDAHTYEIARQYTSGDECLPELVTLGNFLKITEQCDFAPEKTALLMPTANGPCRFGQYKYLIHKILHDLGLEEIYLFSPSSANGYEGFGKSAKQMVRRGWWAVIASDILRKLLLKTRPYEVNKGETDRMFQESLDLLCKALARQNISMRERKRGIEEALEQVGAMFESIEIDKSTRKPVIGIVGEIFCRLNDFSNNYIINKIEEYGGEVWISDVGEWVWYTNWEERSKLIREQKRLSLSMLGNSVRRRIMRADEHTFMKFFSQQFVGYEEPPHIRSILERSRPYLPSEGSLGEMVLNVGKAIWYHDKGASGVIDISPFSCMNAIISEAIYPRVSRNYGNIPIRTFYFDGTQGDLDRDVEIFMELARNYLQRFSHSQRYAKNE